MARDQFAALLPIYERVLGPEHPDTLAARATSPLDWGGGDAAGARDQFAALLPIRERVQGPEHPDTLTTRATSPHWTGQCRGCGRGPRPASRPASPSLSGSWAPSTLSP